MQTRHVNMVLDATSIHRVVVGRLVRRVALALGVLSAALAIVTPAAMAHSDLASSTPSDGATLLEPVSEIELVFASPIDFDSSSFEVINEFGDNMSAESVSIARDSATVTIVVDPPIYQGAVGVGYTIVSADSHPRSGSITFAVDAALPTPTPQPTTTPAPTVAPSPTVAPVAPTSGPKVEAERVDAVAAPVMPSPSPSATSTPLRDGDADPGLVVASSSPDLSELLAPPAALTRMTTAQSAVRGVGYGAGAVLIGGLLFFAVVAKVNATGLRRRTLQVAALGTVLSGLGLLALQAGIAGGGDWSAVVNPGDWGAVFRGNFVPGVAMRILGGLGALAALSERRRTTVTAGVIAGGLVALSFPFLGHGASRTPTWLVFPADLVHVGVVSLWTGGLLMLLLELHRRRPVSLSATAKPVTGLVERFSTFAGMAVALAAVTGIMLAATELNTFAELLSTTYGRRLIVKVALVGAIAALGALQRFRLIPNLRSKCANPTRAQKVIRTATIEIILMATVVVTTTLLVSGAG